MSRIVTEAEALMFGDAPGVWSSPTWMAAAPAPGRAGTVLPITEGVVEAASLVCRRLGAALLVVATHSGRTALALSKQRNATPTLALTDDDEVARAMALYWGVTPLSLPRDRRRRARARLRPRLGPARGLVAPGDRVVLLRGTIPDNPTHNAMLVQEVK